MARTKSVGVKKSAQDPDKKGKTAKRCSSYSHFSMRRILPEVTKTGIVARIMTDMARHMVELVATRADALRRMNNMNTITSKHVEAALVQMLYREPEYAAQITKAVNETLKKYEDIAAEDKKALASGERKHTGAGRPKKTA